MPPRAQGFAVASDQQPQLLQRVERARRVVSLCSQATIRAYDEEALLAEACRILLDTGDYAMAWIAETQEGGALVPLAHAGIKASGVRSVELPWTSDPGRRSPALRAIQEQRPQVVRGNAQASPAHARYSGALPPGCGAMCAFPIQFGPRGAGVIAVYAREAEAFAPEEVALLRELAGDLAVGVAGLRAKLAGDELEAKLEMAERRLRSLIENAPTAILQVNNQGKVLTANQALADLVGYPSPDAIVAQSAAELAGHLDEGDCEALLRDLRSETPHKPREIKVYRLDGTRIWVEVQARRGEGPRSDVIDAFVRDLTPGRTAQLSASRLAAVVDASEQAIIGIDPKGTVVTWSKGAHKLYGYEAPEVVGLHLGDAYVPADRQAEWTAMLAALAKGERVQRFDTRRLAKSNAVMEVSVAASPILDSDGHVVGASLIEHDVADRNRADMNRLAQERQQQEVVQLQALTKMRADFMNRASHELNTPLTPVLLQVQALRDGGGLDSKQTRGLALIERNVVRLAALVKDLLSAATLTSNPLALKPKDMDVADLVSSAVASFQAQAVHGQVNLVAASEGPVHAFADRDRVMQVLFNLIGNALRYTPAHGTVTITARQDEAGTAVVVHDTGQGFSSDKQDRLFKPFGRLHEDIPGTPPGTGLGLFISKGIIDGSGGRLFATSDGPGQGATFTFTLPSAPPVRPGHGIKAASGFHPATTTAPSPQEPNEPKTAEPVAAATARRPAEA